MSRAKVYHKFKSTYYILASSYRFLLSEPVLIEYRKSGLLYPSFSLLADI